MCFLIWSNDGNWLSRERVCHTDWNRDLNYISVYLLGEGRCHDIPFRDATWKIGSHVAIPAGFFDCRKGEGEWFVISGCKSNDNFMILIDKFWTTSRFGHFTASFETHRPVKQVGFALLFTVSVNIIMAWNCSLLLEKKSRIHSRGCG
jgi:hypothetical protein